MSINPLANRPRADACGFGNGLRRLSARDLPYNALSTARRQPGILMHVHPVLPWNLKLQQPQLPRSEPDGQPTESSQLAGEIIEVICADAARYGSGGTEAIRALATPHRLQSTPPSRRPSPRSRSPRAHQLEFLDLLPYLSRLPGVMWRWLPNDQFTAAERAAIFFVRY